MGANPVLVPAARGFRPEHITPGYSIRRVPEPESSGNIGEAEEDGAALNGSPTIGVSLSAGVGSSIP